MRVDRTAVSLAADAHATTDVLEMDARMIVTGPSSTHATASQAPLRDHTSARDRHILECCRAAKKRRPPPHAPSIATFERASVCITVRSVAVSLAPSV